jgi:hypothetical protein
MEPHHLTHTTFKSWRAALKAAKVRPPEGRVWIYAECHGRDDTVEVTTTMAELDKHMKPDYSEGWAVREHYTGYSTAFVLTANNT